MVADLLLQAANLMLIGMVAVFAFLCVLVILVQLISAITQRYYPVKPVERSVSSEPPSGNPTPAVLAAISAAIHQYRQQQQ